MIETHELAHALGEKLKALILDGGQPLLREVRTIGRKMKTGAIQIIGSETYAGPEGHAAPYAYIRFRDGSNEHTFQPRRGLTSEVHLEVRAHLRLVVVHRCNNEGGLQTATVAAMLHAGIDSGGAYSVNLLNASGRGQTVQRAETGGDGEEREDNDYLGEANLLAIDFDLIYTVSAGLTDCNFTCDGCC